MFGKVLMALSGCKSLEKHLGEFGDTTQHFISMRECGYWVDTTMSLHFQIFGLHRMARTGNLKTRTRTGERGTDRLSQSLKDA